MIAVVHFSRKSREFHGHKGMHFDTRLSHPLKELVFNIPTTYIVIDDTHFHALRSFLHQLIGHHITQRIVVENVRVNMDMILGFANIPQQHMEEIIAGGIDIHLIILERK